MSNEEIVQELQDGIDVTLNQERLWLQNKGMIYKLVRQCLHGDDFRNVHDDLAQQGFIGLINAATKYKQNGNAVFITYAIPFISGAMYSYIANTYNIFHIPQYMRKRLREYDVILNDPCYKNISDSEICEIMDISEKSLANLKITKSKIDYYSLDKCVPDGDETLYGITSDGTNGEDAVLDVEYKRELHNTLENALSILDKKTVQMIKCIYFLNYSKTKVATIMNCSETYVGCRIERAFSKIRNTYGEELAAFMEEGFTYKKETLNDCYDNYEDDGNLFLI